MEIFDSILIRSRLSPCLSSNRACNKLAKGVIPKKTSKSGKSF